MKSIMFVLKKNNKIALNSNDHKRNQSTDLIEEYAYKKNKYIVCKNEDIKCNNVIKQYKNV